ncbi:MAG TPA: hypothetical protein VH988_10660 [Thermoanaerobaculia bacterium]|jgi:hypothetical protein|nr:hypothetical protein [Thermoanaerobaculia bacterium]
MRVSVSRGILAFVFLLGASLAPPDLSAQSCGVERWSVKTGTDADVGLVNVNSTTANTILTMRGWTAPNPIPSNNRVSPFETTVWVLNATLTQYKLESDSDYHLILQDASGNTMIAEIPLPSCVGSSSPFLSKITSARNAFNARFTPTGSFQTANIPVQITGVGMFDFLHGQTGVAPNGIELHPVLSIVFNPTTSPDFAISASPATVSAVQGGSGTTTVSTTVSGGFNSAVSLSASGLPAGATATFSPTSIAAPGSGSSTLTLGAGTAAAGTYTVTITGTGGGKTHSTTVSFTVTTTTSPDFALFVSPTSVSTASGSASTATASTTVSGGFNAAVALSISGVPTGATAAFSPTSIAAPGSGSSTLTLTTGTAAAGTYNLTITGTGGGKTHTAALTWTITSGGGGTQVLVNPGFESGNTTWVASSGVIDTSASEAAHSGSWKAWLDGYGTTHTDTLYQQIAIFSSHTSATLTFWLHIDTAETSTTTAFDTLQVQIRNSSGTLLQTLATYSNLNANTGYAQKSFDLSAYIGQTIRVYLTGTEDSTLQTSFVVDDFALNVQ